ncbi:uncharacterized protein EAE98_004092 [Botrytis deweyae]|uniref:Uncharacterized protein n=2 Tax=Botrytis TaxID=33196 RepID=A0A4Z1J7U2_9HELO|nr:uncharacterized protein EAE98_004092 [Botrytis deweyae]KAF7924797.1 hypothetical protein EAE99_006274 [Botrytis elliptica]KAF7932793.1 hypothetical protein EAE98_004092 [Botrytis deweyae]TGO69711.1 hypothetical protein BELL_0760g00060 [Botrytis elliptica]
MNRLINKREDSDNTQQNLTNRISLKKKAKLSNVSKLPFVKEMKVASHSSCSDMNLLNGVWWGLALLGGEGIGIWGTCNANFRVGL